ncbi:MAG: methionyl-tRNA formyltransferase [Myxococcaceae bacterium]
MRIVFMGTPVFAVASLRACLELGEVVAVVTQPDKPKGRGNELAAPPVKELALERGLKILQPAKIKNTNFADELRALAPEVCVVTAYGKILPKDVLEVPKYGCVNVHASLLPRWRGAAPIQWSIAAGDPKTGVCLMKMDEGLDTGPEIARAEIPIGPEDTSSTLHDRLSELGGELLVRELPRYLRGELVPVSQPAEGATYAPMIKKEDGRLDFTRPAAELERRVRAFTPWPGAFTFLSGSLLKVHKVQLGQGNGLPGTVLETSAQGIEVACGGGSLWIVEVQPEGRRRMRAAEFLAGRRIEKGSTPFALDAELT